MDSKSTASLNREAVSILTEYSIASKPIKYSLFIDF